MRRFWALLAVLVTVVGGCGEDSGNGQSPAAGDRFDAQRAFRDLRAQVRIGPRPAGSATSREEVRLIGRKLREAGVTEVRVQHPRRNVIGHIPGESPGTVVVGAHHDTKDIRGFVGANDGASGVAVLLELARGLPRRLPGPSIDLVFFDAEEAHDDKPFETDGARGSRQYFSYAQQGAVQGSAPVDEIRAMVLLDLVGDCKLGIPREVNSDSDLYQLFSDAAEEEPGPSPFVGTAGAVLDDHIPFVQAGIPSVDLIDLTYGPGPTPGSFWHTLRDNLAHVCPRSLDAVGETALDVLPRIR
ncbi:MAG TPA: M28 family peptidase [Solirubrobacterales bacterium]|nr:M28 family peptidase [Solirubrobacterales bacterium]